MKKLQFMPDAVCYFDGEQHFDNSEGLVQDGSGYTTSFYNAMNYDDFQLNEISTEDFIQASELGTEQKYNDVVEVFGLFGFKFEVKEFDFVTYNYIIDDERANIKISSEGYLVGSLRGGNRKLTYHQIIAIGKLKRMMLEREKSAPKTNPDLIADFAKASSNKYEREITDRQGNSATVDVYDVLKAFEVKCPATQHAVKKLLFSGLRGHKDLQTDLIEAKESIVRAIELN